MANKFRKAKSLYSSTSNSFGTGESETITPSSVAGLPTDTEIVLTFDRLVTGKLERILGTISGGNFVISSGGRGYDNTTEQAHTSPTVEYIPNAADTNELVDGILVGHTQTGAHIASLPLTTPKITTSINDSAGNELFKVTATGSAVNEFTVANAATGNNPTFSATGGDSNIGIDVQPKGTGVFNIKATADSAAEVRLFEDTDNGSNYIGLKSPASVSSSKTFVLPDADGSANQLLKTDGSGNLGWVDSPNNTDGWIATADTWTYASASTFTISGVNRTSIYTAGTRLKFTQTTTKYAVVVSSTFSTNTTVTIAVNTDYTIANAAITSPYYSYQSKPQGYPSFFNYTPTYTGFSANPTTGTAFFSVNGGICHVFHTESAAGTSNATSFTITTPVAPNSTVATNGVSGLGQGTDNGSNLTAPISIFCTGGSTTLTLYKDISGTAWTNTGNKRATNISIFYPI